MSLYRWRRHGCIKSYPLTKLLWKKIWKIEHIPGLLWQLHKSNYIRFKNKHISIKNKQKNKNTLFSSTLSVTNPLIWYEIIFIITHEKKIRSSPWAHIDLLMSSLRVHSDQNAEPWPSREFTVMKMLTGKICFLVGFPHRSGSSYILFCSSRNWLTMWFKKPSATNTK